MKKSCQNRTVILVYTWDGHDSTTVNSDSDSDFLRKIALNVNEMGLV
jgi:hypothetical protein